MLLSSYWGEVDDREVYMFAYKVAAVGWLIVVTCTIIAGFTLAEKLLSQ